MRALAQRLSPVGAALVIIGAGALLLGSSLPARATAEAGVARPVNEGAGDPRDIDAHNTPTLARNPEDGRNLVVVNRIDTPRFSCAMHVSFDSGTTWSRSQLPFPAGEEDPPRCFAPDAAFGGDGTLYVSFVTLQGLGNTPNAAWVVSSTDGGRTLSSPARALGPLAFQVRLAADPSQPKRLYLSWLQASATATFGFPETGYPIQVQRSDDGGRTWAPPVQVSSPGRQRVVAPSVAVGRSGDVHVVHLDLGEDRLDHQGAHQGRGGPAYDGTWSLVLAASGDGGASWQETVVDDGVVPIERVIVLFPASPTLAVGSEGSIYVAFHDGRLGDADVWLWTSPGRGLPFAPGRRVNDTPTEDGTSQYLPKVAVAPGGRVDLLYYDRRSDAANVMNEVSLQSSFDGGRTFSRGVSLAGRTFDSRIGFGSERNLPDLGSRLGLVSTDRTAHATWADTRGGTQASNKQDLAHAVVELSDRSPWRTPLRILGLMTASAGMIVLIRRWPRKTSASSHAQVARE